MTMWKRTSVNISENFNTRAADGNLYIEGYFAVFGKQYRLWEGAVEMIDPHAFDDFLRQNPDVRALINHDTTLVLGRTTAGTLTLKVDERGLWGSILINQDDSAAMDLYARVKRRDVTQCSFGFDITGERTDYLPDGTFVWTVLNVILYEVSVCTFPAYEDTSVEVRRNDYNHIRKRQNEQWREKALSRLKGV